MSDSNTEPTKLQLALAEALFRQHSNDPEGTRGWCQWKAHWMIKDALAAGYELVPVGAVAEVPLTQWSPTHALNELWSGLDTTDTIGAVQRYLRNHLQLAFDAGRATANREGATHGR